MNERISEPVPILKVLVGSRAHGTATEASDWDHRGVFIHPTAAYYMLNSPKPKETAWLEGDVTQGHDKKDDTSWELGHFLNLAIQCNPSILEVFAAPRILQTEMGQQLVDLFPYIWDPKKVVDSFCGYSKNQRTKLLEGDRGHKYAQAYYRVLLQAEGLLKHRRLLVGLKTHPSFQTLMLIRAGCISVGNVVDLCRKLEEEVRELATKCDQKPDLYRVETWYMHMREKNFWFIDEDLRRVAQPVEREALTLEAAGSIPATPAIYINNPEWDQHYSSWPW